MQMLAQVTSPLKINRKITFIKGLNSENKGVSNLNVVVVLYGLMAVKRSAQNHDFCRNILLKSGLNFETFLWLLSPSTRVQIV